MRPVVRRQRVDVDLAELGRQRREGALAVPRLQAAYQHVSAADLRFAEEQRGIVPAAVEQIDHRVRNARHVGLVGTEAPMTRAMSAMSRARSSLK